jgi:glycosyltransferase involved in cell wall biosynthesis
VKKKEIVKVRNEDFPLVSVIIPSFNSARTIDSCIKSILNQTYQNLEIIVVDDGSSDCTLESASKHNVLVIPLKENSGAPHAMNVGAEKARGEYVFFMDADALAPQWLIKKAVDLLIENTSCVAVGGWYIPNAGHALYSLIVHINMLNRSRAPKQVQVYEGKVDPQIYGCFLGFRRFLFNKEKFSETLKAIYDREFMARLTNKSYKVMFARDLFVFHPVPSTLSKIVKTIFVQSMWMAVAGKKCPVIIKYHLFILLMVMSALVLGFLISPLVLVFFFTAYTIVQLLRFLRVRRLFLLSFKKILTLVALTYILTTTTTIGFVLGLVITPSSYWK